MAGIEINQAALHKMLRGTGGMVDRDLRRRAARVLQSAKAQAPGSMPEQITSTPTRRAADLSVEIQSHHHATWFVINGTRPHQIRPRTRKALRFTVGGRIVFAKLVNHPGTKPNDFLNKALPRAL